MRAAGDFLADFSVLSGPGMQHSKKHKLLGVLLAAIRTIICGSEGFTDMLVRILGVCYNTIKVVMACSL